MLLILNRWFEDGFIDEDLNWTAFALRYPGANPLGLGAVELAKKLVAERVAA